MEGVLFPNEENSEGKGTPEETPDPDPGKSRKSTRRTSRPGFKSQHCTCWLWTLSQSLHSRGLCVPGCRVWKLLGFSSRMMSRTGVYGTLPRSWTWQRAVGCTELGPTMEGLCFPGRSSACDKPTAPDPRPSSICSPNVP
jgi:hypothetical protein